MKITHSILITAAALIPLGSISSARAEEERETPVQGSVAAPKGASESALAGLAAIPVADAMTRAMASHPGKVVSAKLENEDGFVVWAIEIANPTGGETEVIIDAGNGAVLKTQVEKADREDGEEHEGEHDDRD